MSPTSQQAHPFRDIFEQYVDEASFLWILRSIAVNQPHYQLSDIAELEQRLDHNISGLLCDPEVSWDVCSEALELEEPGEVFVAAVFAFRSLNVKHIQQVVEVGVSDPQLTQALASAIAWLPESVADPWLEKFLRSKDLAHKFLAMCVFRERREDPGEYLISFLKRNDCTDNISLYTSMLRLIGEIKRKDLIPALNMAMEHQDDNVRLWSLWSAVLLGNRAIAERLESFVETPGPMQEKCLSLYFKSVSNSQAKSLISKMSQDEKNIRAIIKSSAALGDPQVIPWLIGKMENVELARLAGEAFTHITGIFLDQHELSVEVPPFSDDQSAEPDDTSIELDEDEYLVWPDAVKLKIFWKKYGTRFKSGARYIMGKEPNRSHLEYLLEQSPQRIRRVASLELALLDPSSPLINVDKKVI